MKMLLGAWPPPDIPQGRFTYGTEALTAANPKFKKKNATMSEPNAMEAAFTFKLVSQKKKRGYSRFLMTRIGRRNRAT